MPIHGSLQYECVASKDSGRFIWKDFVPGFIHFVKIEEINNITGILIKRDEMSISSVIPRIMMFP